MQLKRRKLTENTATINQSRKKHQKIDDESQLNVHKQLIDELEYVDTSKSWHGSAHTETNANNKSQGM